MRWWDILVPIVVVVVGLAAPENPRGHSGYAVAGVLLCAAAAYAALLLGRRSGVVEFFDRYRSGT
jgi:hypothetical protein